MRAWLIYLLVMVSAPALATSDYAREKKWADEITPSIVVGDPVYLEQANQHKFFGIYTEAAGAKKRLASLKSNPASKQVVIADADHFYANHEDAMVKAVKNFLDSVQ